MFCNTRPRSPETRPRSPDTRPRSLAEITKTGRDPERPRSLASLLCVVGSASFAWSIPLYYPVKSVKGVVCLQTCSGILKHLRLSLDGAIHLALDRVTFERVAKTLLLLTVPIARKFEIGKGAEIGALAKTLYCHAKLRRLR